MNNYFKKYPSEEGFFEAYGGAFIPPVLEVEMKKITDAYHTISKSHNFIQELRSIRKHFQGRPTPVYYCASGRDYPGVGPEHSMLKDMNKVNYDNINDKEAIDAFYELSRLEGIIPALESAHAVAYALKVAKEQTQKSILINLSGPGDKDIDFAVDTFGLPKN